MVALGSAPSSKATFIFWVIKLTAASATPAPGDAAGRTDGSDSTANGDGENGDTANPTGDTDGITDPAADDSGDNTGDSGDNTGDAENV